MTKDENWWSNTPDLTKPAGIGLGTGTDVQRLAEDWIAAKKAVKDAQAHLDKITTALIEQVGIKDEGSKTETVGEYKITSTQNVNYSIDEQQAFALLEDGVINPTLFQEVFHQRLSLSKVAYKEVLELSPIEGNAIQGCLTSKPGKPQIKVIKEEK